MGGCCSTSCLLLAPQHLLESVDGNETEYHQRFVEDTDPIKALLGEGEFGIVKLVYHRENSNAGDGDGDGDSGGRKAYACKILQKGVVFKDNVLYTPLKPEILKGEIDMLRTLSFAVSTTTTKDSQPPRQQQQQKDRSNYCLQLVGVYESPNKLYIVTECCTGGTMTQYVARCTTTNDDFTTHDVSRIAYQLLSALQHCHRYNILHRDIKPDNIMFITPKPGADIRLIDFGSGCMDASSSSSSSSSSDAHKLQSLLVDGTPSSTTTTSSKKLEYVNGLQVHTTFAGSAFYTSPELFNRSYTSMTDIWSVGVTLYVLVAGYPADALQKAFNIIQCDHRDLHTLPNIPNESLPESFYTLLTGCLTYWYQHRPNSTKLLQYEFVNLHRQPAPPAPPPQQEQQQALFMDEVVTDDDPTMPTTMITATKSDATTGPAAVAATVQPPPLPLRTVVPLGKSLAGTVQRHTLFLNFQQYERSVTTLLATLLNLSELEQLIFVLNKRVHVAVVDDVLEPLQQPQQQQQQQQQQSLLWISENQDTTKNLNQGQPQQQQQQLAVIPISELKSILQEDLLKEDIIYKIDKLSNNTQQYDNFAYHTALLNDFVRNNIKDATDKNGLVRSAHFGGRRGSRGGGGGGGFGGSIHQMTGSNASSVQSTSSAARRGSVNVFKSISNKKKTIPTTMTASTSTMKRSVSTNLF